MPDTQTPRLNLALLAAGQSQKHITLNEALMRCDALIHARVLSVSVSAQPATPLDGDAYILPSGAVGADWAGQPNGAMMRYDTHLWAVINIPAGALVYVADTQSFVVRTDTGWVALESHLKAIDNLLRLGIGTGADSYNRLALKSPAALMSAEDGGSGDFSLTLNRSAGDAEVQILWQSEYETRALLGLLGDDDLTLKVSDGMNWREALRVNHVSGRVRFASAPFKTANVVQRRHVAGQGWLNSTTPADHDWQSVVWSPELGRFCAVAASGTGNRVMTSEDGVTWTQRTSAADNSWMSVCWSRETWQFCAVAASGTGNRVMTSPDGVTWTARTSAADYIWSSICWSSERHLFCAVAASGTGNRVMTSPDGAVWTARTTPADLDWRSLVWAGEMGVFVAVASSGTGSRIMTSADGVVWTQQATPADLDWQGLSFSPELNRLVAVAASGSGSRVMTSDDGITWTLRTTPADLEWRSVSRAAEIGLFCAVASSGTGNRVMTSPDGINWSLGVSAADKGWHSVAWSPELGLFAAVANTGTGQRAMTSVSAYSFTYRS
ncbi:DUF2793 domain-containing protein [Asticcacaulis sp. SL142]|uniref:DUF2793 domain-containing protein n=1 Tax=Asticcacaulis sp. SL142 TaxID=2995155 RepID=UPI00226C9FCA|nr:DUF2793 domain-containing protein [Asticcacaulis sp. SL142]WAC48150.1 DUF2793 domain-containing protein [Asticcacaulis sp. SL142]